MWIARPIRVDVSKTKNFSQSLDKARFVSLGGLCEGAVYVKHHECHGKRECRLTRLKISDRANEKGLHQRVKLAIKTGRGSLHRLVRLQ